MTGTAVDAGRVPLDPSTVRRLCGRVVAGPRAARVTTTAPFTGAPLTSIPMSTPDDVRVAVQAARAAQRAWARRPLVERTRPLLRLHDLVLDAQEELLDLIQLECGKARGNAYEELADVAVNARWYARRGPALLADVRAAGVAVALDDFGAGRSSFSHFRKLGLDELKIDRGFVLGMAGDARDAAIVRSVVRLAAELDTAVVAEGVEDAEAADQHSTTGTTPNEVHVGRAQGQDVGYAGETGAERRAAAQQDG